MGQWLKVIKKKWTCLLLSNLEFDSVFPPLKKHSLKVGLSLFLKYARNLSSAVRITINGSNLYYIWILILNIKFVSCFPKKFFS